MVFNICWHGIHGTLVLVFHVLVIIHNFMVLVPGGHPELSKLCNYMMQHHQTAKWKTIGTLLGLPPGELDIIDSDCRGKAVDCSTTMLASWLSLDTTASWEKFKMVIGKTSQPTFISVDFSTISSVKVYLQQRYDARYTRPLKVCLPYKPEHFTNVAFIQHKHSEVTEESVTAVANVTCNGDIIIDDDQSDDILPQSQHCNDYYKSCKKCTDIFKFVHTIDSVPDRKPFLLLIEGAPGMGKTIICKEMALHLSKHQNNELTFLVNLHETKAHNINSFEAFFEYVCPGKQQEEFKTVSHYLSGTKGKNIVVIIDGYEQLFSEAISDSGSFILDIIDRKVLQFQLCDLIVSTRHAALIDLNQYENWYRIELLGFTKELQQEYIERNLDHFNSHDYVTRLTNYIKSNIILKSLCFHPLFINYLVSLHQELKEIPHFQTELLGKFTCVMILWILRNQQEHSFINITSLFKKLPKQYQNNLNEISKLAFSTLQERKVVFELHKEIDKGVCELAIPVGKSYQISLGFVKAFTLFRTSDSKEMVTFCLSLIREFLAAFFVMQSENNVMNLWAKTQWTGKYINVWAYYFGLAKTVREEFKDLLFATRLGILRTNRLSSKILQDKMKCLYLVYCLMELPDEEIYQQAKQVVLKSDNVLDISNCSLTNEALSIVTLFLLRYTIQKWNLFNLSNCCIDDDKLDYFIQQFHHMVNCVPIINIFDVSNNQLTVMSINGILRIANYMVASKIVTSYNKFVDHDIFKSILSFTERPQEGYQLEVIENNRTVFLFCKTDLSHFHLLNVLLTNLYIIRCSLYSKVIDKLINALKTFDNLLLLCLFDNKLHHDDILKLLDVLIVLKQLESFMLYEKSLSDANMDEVSSTVSMNSTVFQVLLVNTNKLLAQGANDHHILMALDYNPSIVHLQLNDCHITDEVMSKIEVILNNSSQQWSLLDLSGSKVGDENLRIFCNALKTDCTEVTSVKLSSNQLTTLSLISQIIGPLNPNLVDISENNIAVDGGKVLGLTEYLSTHKRQSSIHLSCDKDNIMICHKLDHTLVAATLKEPHYTTYLLLVDCYVNDTFLINALQNCGTIKMLHLQNTECNGEFLSCFDILKNYHFTLSIHDSELSDNMVDTVIGFMDKNVNFSVILSTSNTFVAHNCDYEILEWHLAHTVSYMSLNLLYICKCPLKGKPIENYLNKKIYVSEIVLCKNSVESKQLNKIIEVISQKCTTKVFISEDSLNCNHAINKLSSSSIMLVGSRIVIGEGATEKQVIKAAGLVSPSTLVIRMIKCNFTNYGFELLVNVLSACDKIQEFTFCKSNFNDTWGYKVLAALQNNISIKRLHLTSSNLSAHGVDSVATTLATVISNNTKLERLSIVFNTLPVTASSIILKSISEITSLKQLSYYNSEHCASELTTAINTNPGLEELRLNNNNLQTDEIIQISVAVDKLSSLKILSLTNNNGLSKDSAINLSFAFNNKQLHTLHLGSNDLQSEGIIAMAEILTDVSTLRNLILSNNGITEEGSDSLAFLINANKNLEKLYLDNNLLRSAGLNKVSNILKHFTTLKVLNLKCNKLDSEAANGIAAVITSNQSLEIINLSDNNLQTVGIIKVARALQTIHSLKSLDISKNQITERAADDISVAISSNTGLEKLIFSNNAFKSSGITTICVGIVKHINILRVLRISNNSVEKEAAGDIAEVIIHNPFLEVVEVGNNRLLSEGVMKITNALEKVHHIKELCCNANCITEEAADGIAAAIASNTKLEKFSLDDNHLNSTGITKVCGALKKISTLKVLFVGNNKTHKCAAGDIAEVITNNPLLEYVGLANNQLQTEGVVIMANALKQIHNLTVLSLDNNEITVEAANDIALAISSNSRLEKLWLNNNTLGTKGIQIISQALQQLNTLRLLQLENNSITVEATKEIANVIIHNPLLEHTCIGENNLQLADTNTFLYSRCSIKQLKLSLGHEKVSDEAVEIILAVIASSIKLEEFKLKRNALKGQSVRIIAGVLKGNLELKVLHFNVCGAEIADAAELIINNPQLEYLYLHNSVLKQQEFINILCSLKKIHKLKELNLNKNHFSDRQPSTAKQIAEVILSNRGLEKLWLINNNLNDTDVAKISAAFKDISTLRVFHLAYNDITEEAADDIAKIIINNPALENINLGHNRLKSKGVIKVANALKTLSHLKVIALYDNGISEVAANDIAEVIDSNTGLEQLWLNDNKLMSSGIKIICQSLKQISFLKSLQIKNNHITKEAAGEIASVITNNTLIQELCLGNNRLQTEGVIEIASAISNVHQIKMLSLNDNEITEDAGADISTAIVSNTTLEKLWLHNNKLNDKGIKLIANAFKIVNTIKTLDFENNRITEEVADDLATVIYNNPLLEKLHLGNNKLQSKGIIKLCCSLKKIHKLTELHLADNNISEEAADEICKVISSNVNLEKLWLYNSNLRNVGICKIAVQLKKISSLRLLHLNNTSITEEAADDITAVIDNNPLLQSVFVSNNDLKSVGVRKIANALKSLSYLIHLEFSNNGITEVDANDIAEAVTSNSHLKYLWMNNNKLKAEGIHNLCKGLKQLSHLKLLTLSSICFNEEAAHDVAEVIINNHKLEILSLNNNKLKSAGINKITNALQDLSTLKFLQLDDNEITTEAADGIAAVINNNPLLQTVALGNNKLETEGVIKIASALKNINSLKVLGLNNNCITDKAANAIADVIYSNTELEELYLNDNNLKSNGAEITCKSLMHIVTLKVLQLENNSIIEEAADDIAAVIHHNPLLEILALGNNKLQSKGVSTLCCSLKKIQHVKEFTIHGNSITEEVGDNIAEMVTSNYNLEKLWIKNNKLKSAGIIKISNALQHCSSLKLLQLDDNDITTEAADGIAAVINNNPLLQTVTLGNNQLETEGVIKITSVLKNINSLKVLGLNNNFITDKAANAIADVIYSNTELEKLYLNDNDLQSKGTKIICKSLMHIVTLKLLQLDNNKITEEAANDISRLIISPSLEILHLGNNKLQSNGVSTLCCSLKKILYLKEFSIRGNSITEEAGDSIAEVIASNCDLEKLWLNNNKLKSAGIIKITNAFQYCSSLKLLQLDDNDITTEAADGIAAVINNNPLLQTVTLGNNKLETEGVIKIASALKNINSLKVLRLNNNCITDKAANAIADVVCSNTELEKLYLNDNDLHSNGIEIICKSLMHITTLKLLQLDNNKITEEAANDISRAIISNPSLEILHLCNNKLQSKGVSILCCSLKKIYHLKEFSINGNSITKEAGDNIAEAIASNCDLEKLWLTNNKLKSTGIIKITNALQFLNSLKLLQLDNNEITTEAADGIAAVINNNPLLQIVTLDNNKLETEGVIKIASALKNINSLKVFGLNNNCITDKAANAIADVICSNTELERLYLNDNNLQSNGTYTICKSLLHITTLKLLLLQNNSITEEAADNLAAVIISNPLLENFDISGNKINSKGLTKVVEELKALSYLKVLSVNNTQITDDVASDIAQVISNNCALEKVWLNNSKLKSAGIIKISNALQHLNTLKLLQLDGNEITTEAADGIAAVIHHNPSLEILCLGNNKLHSKGVSTLCCSLKKIHHLKLINLHSNSITEEAANDIAEVTYSNCELEKIWLNNNKLQFINHSTKFYKSTLFAKNSKLQELHLNHCLLKSSVATNIMCGLKSHCSIKVLILHCNYITNRHEVADNIAQGILGNSIEEFYISRNRLQARGMATVLRSLKQLNSLTELSLGSNDITEDISDDIAKVITNNTGLEMLGINYTCVYSDGAAKVIRSLKSLSHLKLLEMPGNNINEEAADDIAVMITNNTSLVKLYIADNRLGTDGVIKIAKTLVNPRGLEVLDLTNNNITSEAAESIAKVVLANPSLQSLLLGEGCSQLRNTIKPMKSNSNTCDCTSVIKLNDVFIAEQMLRIKEDTKIYGPLHSFYYSIVDVSIYCSRVFETSQDNFKFSSTCSVKSNYNILQSDGVKQICKAFSCVTSLQVLNIENNDVDDEAADDIATVLANNTGIKQLWIGENNFTSTGITTIL